MSGMTALRTHEGDNEAIRVFFFFFGAGLMTEKYES